MLGNGRPFIIELVNAKKKLSFTKEMLSKIEENVNKNPLVGVNSLRLGEDDVFMKLKESENVKIKMYTCIVVTKSPISDEKMEELNKIEELVVKQKTPLRVLHRRTLMFRDKMVHKLRVKRINDNCYVVYVLASAGTYIKEFIHGDLKRTLPYFGQLAGVDYSDIIQLDVLDIFKELNEESLTRFDQLCEEFYG